MPPQEIEINGKNYSVAALDKASHNASHCATFAERLLQARLKGWIFGRGRLPRSAKKRQKIYNELFHQAQQWMNTLKSFEFAELQRIQKQMEDSMPVGHDGSKIIIPTAGMMKDHLPPSSIPHV